MSKTKIETSPAAPPPSAVALSELIAAGELELSRLRAALDQAEAAANEAAVDAATHAAAFTEIQSIKARLDIETERVGRLRRRIATQIEEAHAEQVAILERLEGKYRRLGFAEDSEAEKLLRDEQWLRTNRTLTGPGTAEQLEHLRSLKSEHELHLERAIEEHADVLAKFPGEIAALEARHAELCREIRSLGGEPLGENRLQALANAAQQQRPERWTGFFPGDRPRVAKVLSW